MFGVQEKDARQKAVVMEEKIQVLCEGISPVLFDRMPIDEPLVTLGDPNGHSHCCGFRLFEYKYVSTVE